MKIIDNITESQISVEELEKTEITDKSAMDNDSDIVALLREEFVKKSTNAEKRILRAGFFFHKTVQTHLHLAFFEYFVLLFNT